jgi:hypothetical protein
MHVGSGNQERLREKTSAQFKLDFATEHREFRLIMSFICTCVINHDITKVMGQ